MGSRQIVLVSTAGISVHNAGIFWREAKTKRLFSQCMAGGPVRQTCAGVDFIPQSGIYEFNSVTEMNSMEELGYLRMSSLHSLNGNQQRK